MTIKSAERYVTDASAKGSSARPAPVIVPSIMAQDMRLSCVRAKFTFGLVSSNTPRLRVWYGTISPCCSSSTCGYLSCSRNQRWESIRAVSADSWITYSGRTHHNDKISAVRVRVAAWRIKQTVIYRQRVDHCLGAG